MIAAQVAKTSVRLMIWPTGDEGRAVSALPLVAFHAAQRPRAVVLVVAAHGDHGRHLRAVVGAEHHEGVVGDAERFERFHQLADDPIHLEDEVPVRAGFGFSFERVRRKRWQVHGLHRVV